MKTETYSFYTKSDGHPIGFDTVVQGIAGEAARVLQVTAADLEMSFNNAMSAVIGRNDHLPRKAVKALGHVRFSPLLDPRLMEKLGVEDCPQIWEMGTGFMDPNTLRGKGLYGPLRNVLLKMHLEQINSGQVLIIGTTKTKAVLNVLKEAMAVELGAFYANHLAIPYISAFTCVCEGNFGQGFQHGINACGKRTDQSAAPPAVFFNAQEQMQINQIIPDQTGIIPCYLYAYGKPEAALRIDDRLRQKFGSVDALVNRLRQPDINYYREYKVRL